MRNCIFQLLIIFSAASGRADSIHNLLEHKSNLIEDYLNGISFNSSEKTELFKYIKPAGSYLEIGTGGDPIAAMLLKLPSGYAPTIIAADIDPAVLTSLPHRHPVLLRYLNSVEHGEIPKLRLLQVNATDLSEFENESLSGINASSIVHEILSYAGGQAGLEKFFKEAFRVLERDGVLVYRGPEGVLMPYQTVIMDLKTRPVKLFTHLFLCKFLNTKHKYINNQNQTEVSCYNASDVEIYLYQIGDEKISCLTYEEYMNIPTHQIDFSRKYSLKLPRQLCREIERHYLTFLHDCNPLAFVKCIPDPKSDLFHVALLSQRIEAIFNEYVKKYHISFVDGKVDLSGREKIYTAISRRMTHIENGVRIKIASEAKQQELRNILSNKKLNPDLYIQKIENGWVLLDYRVFGLLYKEFSNWFDADNSPFGKVSELAAKWLMLEGEEIYFYASADALITSIGHLTFLESIKNKNNYVLCPISAEENRYVSRNHYVEFLNESISITDEKGYPVEIKEGKRIIHFAKIPIKNALPIYTKICAINPAHYPMLSVFLENLYN